MKSNLKYTLVAIFGLIGGLSLGYLFFGSDSNSEILHPEESKNQARTILEEQVWTCSMHPQIRQNEPGLCPICEMDLIPLESNTSNDPLVLQMTDAAAKLANIQTTVVGSSDSNGEKTISLSGKVQADERLASTQVSHLSGRIEKLFVTFTGEKVNKGQKIATIYSPDLITAQRELLEALQMQDVSPGLVEAARNKLRYWKFDEAFIGALESDGKISETFTLVADESGVVINKRISVGDYVNKGEALFDLIDLQRVWVLFDAYEEDLSIIKKGDHIEFSTPAIPGKKYRTQITFIDPVINPLTRVASLRTEVANNGGLLKPEMFVSGVLKQRPNQKTFLSIPKTAVLWTGTRSVVYVKVKDASIPSFQYREIELGENLGDQYLVIRGLDFGEEVVTNGGFTIDAAAQLNNQASMMNKKVSLKEESIDIPEYQNDTPNEFKKQISSIADSYMLLKDAFVQTDAEKAAQNAVIFQSVLEKATQDLLTGEAYHYWVDQKDALIDHGEKIGTSKDIEEQRIQFGFISSLMIQIIESFGTSGDSIYVQYCPMAFDNKGADWLAKEEQIQNPYFGDKMMKCGIVKRNLTKVSDTKNNK